MAFPTRVYTEKEPEVRKIRSTGVVNNEMAFHRPRDSRGLPRRVGCVRRQNGFSRRFGGGAKDSPGLVCAGDGLVANDELVERGQRDYDDRTLFESDLL